MAADSIVNLIVRVVDRAVGPLRKIDAQFRKLDDTVKMSNKRFAHFDSIGKGLTKVGTGMTVAGGGLAYGLGLTEAVSQSIKAEHALRSLGNVGEMTRSQVKAMGQDVVKTAVATNQEMMKIIEGVGVLVASGISPDVAVKFMPTIGKAATATPEAEISELSDTAFTMYDNLKVPIDELGKAMNIVTKAGQMGKFELKDMARYFPMLTAGAQSYGMTGLKAVTQLAAAAQVARKGAGTPEEAARNFQNFFQKISSRETVKNFAKFGVNVQEELNKIKKTGADPIEHWITLIQKKTGGNRLKLNEIFADMQVSNFLLSMMQNMARYREVRDESFKQASMESGVIEENFNNMMETTQEQWKKLKINMGAAIMPALNGFFSGLNVILTKINSSGTATKAILGSVVGLFAGGIAISGLGLLFSGFAKIPGIISGMKVLWGVMKVGRLVMMATTAATWLFNAALWTCPITWIIAGIIALGAAAFLVIKYWKPITAFFKNLWVKIVNIWNGAVKWMKDTGKNLILNLVQGMLSVINKPGEIMRAGLKKLRDLLPFSPAKEGPLRDLHKVKIMETLATSVNSAPLVNSVKGALSSARSAMAPGSAGPRGGITLNYSPTMNVGANASKDDFLQMLKKHKDEIMRMMKDASLRDERLAY
jgi:TP901 family phage tail tape measure protein